MKITVGHTHDADDAFLYYAMFNGKIETEGLSFEDFIEPIFKLNNEARRKKYMMTALSVASLPEVADKYDILTAGACMAEKRGPLLYMQKKDHISTVAVPGFNTTAYITAKLYNDSYRYKVMPFDMIKTAVENGDVDAGVLISEDQMRIDRTNFNVIDLGEWWHDKTALPLPLGIDLIDRSLPEEIKLSVNRVFRNSIRYALNNPEEAGEYAIKFGRGIGMEEGLKFVTTFVNSYTVDLGTNGRNAVIEFLKQAFEKKIIGKCPELNFVS